VIYTEIYSFILLIALIFIFTIFTSLGGLGAAFIIIPTLLLFNYSIVLASIMGLVFNFVNTFTSSIRHARHNVIVYQLSVPIILASLIGAPVGALFVNILPASVLKLIFGMTIVILGLNIIRKSVTNTPTQVEDSELLTIPIQYSLLVGFLVGFVSGLLGIGGGAIVLPLFLYFGLETKKAAGTTSFIVVFSSFIGIISKLLLNNYEFDLTLLIAGLIASIFGAIIGTYLMHFKIKQIYLKISISLLLIVIGIKMIVEYF